MAQAKGILIVMMEPPTAGEDEFNDWYDFEHILERAAVPGFESALRYICLSGWPRYMALYDLASIEVMDGPGIPGDRRQEPVGLVETGDPYGPRLLPRPGPATVSGQPYDPRRQ